MRTPRRLVAPASDQSLGQIIGIICDIREELRRQGASQAAIDQATENVVRDRWPFTREWKYLCPLCDDTGLRVSFESARIYGETRVWVGRPCSCSRGERFRDRPKASDDFTQAGKAPAKPTRWGRS